MKNLTFLVVSFIAKYVLSLFRNKIVAVYLGPTGIGIQGLINSMSGWITSFLIFGQNTTIVLDKSKDIHEDLKINLAEYIVRILILSILLYFLVLVTNISLDFEMSWIEFSLVFSILIAATSIIQALIQASKRPKYYSKLIILSALVNTTLTLIYVYIFGESSSVILILFISAFSPLVVYFVGARDYIVWQKPEYKAKLLLNFSWEQLTILLLSISAPIFYYLVRLFLSQKHGLIEVGYFTANYALASLPSAFIIKGMSIKMFPELIAVGTSLRDRTKIIDNYLIIITCIYIVITPIVFLLDEVVLKSFFSNDFIAGVDGFRLMLVAQYFRSVGFLVSYVLQTARKFKHLLFIDMLSYSLSLVVIIFSGLSVYNAIILAFSLMYICYVLAVKYYGLIVKSNTFVVMGILGLVFLLVSKVL